MLISLIGLLLSATHEVLTVKLAPFNGPLDTTIHIMLIASKACIVSLFVIALKEIFAAIYKNTRVSLVYFSTLNILFISLFFLHLTFTRELYCSLASNDAVKFYYLSNPDLHKPFFIGGVEWAKDWALFIPQSKELIFGITCTMLFTLWGCYFGPTKKSRFGITAILFVICTIVPGLIGILLWDYDLFMGGVFFDTISITLFPLFWFAEGTQSVMIFSLAFFFYLHGYIFVKHANQSFKRDS